MNFDAAWKKQIDLPSFVYAGIPYHVFDTSSGTAALTISWMRPAIERSGSGISAILARTSASPAALSAPRFAARFASTTASFIAAFSSAVQIFVVFWAMAGSSLSPIPMGRVRRATGQAGIGFGCHSSIFVPSEANVLPDERKTSLRR